MKLFALASITVALRFADAYALSPRGSLDAPTPTTNANGITTPQPIASDMTSNCNRFTIVTSKEKASFITDNYNITLDELYAWNPSLGGDFDANAHPWFYYCAGIIGDGPNPPPPTGTGNAISTPSPVVSDMLQYCSDFHQIEYGDTCETIANGASITVDKFLQINPVINSCVEPFWAAYFYCTAVIIPTTSY